jgi:hypothetical protein
MGLQTHRHAFPKPLLQITSAHIPPCPQFIGVGLIRNLLVGIHKLPLRNSAQSAFYTQASYGTHETRLVFGALEGNGFFLVLANNLGVAATNIIMPFMSDVAKYRFMRKIICFIIRKALSLRSNKN